MYFKDGAQTAFVKALEETYVTAVGSQGIRPEEESGKNHVSVVTCVQSTKEIFAIKRLLSISLSILESDAMM